MLSSKYVFGRSSSMARVLVWGSVNLERGHQVKQLHPLFLALLRPRQVSSCTHTSSSPILHPRHIITKLHSFRPPPCPTLRLRALGDHFSGERSGESNCLTPSLTNEVPMRCRVRLVEAAIRRSVRALATVSGKEKASARTWQAMSGGRVGKSLEAWGDR